MLTFSTSFESCSIEIKDAISAKLFGSARLIDMGSEIGIKTAAENVYPATHYEKAMVNFLLEELLTKMPGKEIKHVSVACPGGYFFILFYFTYLHKISHSLKTANYDHEAKKATRLLIEANELWDGRLANLHHEEV